MQELIVGEFHRTLDERFRLSLPAELLSLLGENECVLAKERPGCLSLWNGADWQAKLESGIDLVRGKIQSGRLDAKIEQVQILGRLLATRHKRLRLSGRGRLLIPEGFREFLQVEAGSEVVVVGAAVCLEIWKPEAWIAYLEQTMPDFRELLEELAG
ncbi:MAG: division/cell wall cluster transcriptional repressor MraZ [Pirellulaceae bacterium]|nr:division/cell wall cluster transcriptional repressor MraZ [Pirellulaceae bacterium]